MGLSIWQVLIIIGVLIFFMVMIAALAKWVLKK